jgi:hypothetical protein
MTPLPKNKITRVERGKRRAGNTPKLRKDAGRARIPHYKDKLVQKLKLTLRETRKVDDKEQKIKLAEKLLTKRAKKTKVK